MIAPVTGKPTLDQRRAGHAWDAVKRVQALKPEEQKDYGREAKKLPARIHTAGLGHAFAFLHSKGHVKLDDDPSARGKAGKEGEKNPKSEVKPGFEQLIADITDWVLNQRALPAGDQRCLMQSIVEGDAFFLRRATEETLAYLLWLVRFAEAAGLTKEADAER